MGTSWTDSKFLKKSLFWSVFSYSNSKPFLKWIVMCDEKWILYNWQWPAQCLDREAAPKHFPKPNLHQKKVMVTVWWSAACLIHYSFLNPGKTITSEKYTHQTDELHQKPQYLSQHRSTKRAQFFSTNLTACQTTTASKVGTNLATKFCFIHHI